MTNKQIDNRVKKLKDLNARITELEAQAAAIREEITREMETRELEELATDSFLVRWTKVLSNRFDSRLFKSEAPELYQAYTKQTESRRFSIA